VKPGAVRGATAALAASGVLLAGAGPAMARPPSPEADSQAKPDDHAGYFLGYPSETSQWHGCTKTSTEQTPATLDEGVPAPGRGNAHNKVTWTATTTSAATAGYVLSWKVADGWKICGAEAAILGSDPHQSFDLAMEAGYPSKRTKGSTVTSGAETVRVKLSKKDCKKLGIDAASAGDYAVSKIYAITVFVKKKQKK
jgi:hypothetical protein